MCFVAPFDACCFSIHAALLTSLPDIFSSFVAQHLAFHFFSIFSFFLFVVFETGSCSAPDLVLIMQSSCPRSQIADTAGVFHCIQLIDRSVHSSSHLHLLVCDMQFLKWGLLCSGWEKYLICLRYLSSPRSTASIC